MTQPPSFVVPARCRFLVVAAIASVATAIPASAHAQESDAAHSTVDRARELFVHATDQRDAGDARGALEKFKAAHDLAPNPVTAIELGRTYAMLGMLLEARAAFLSIGRIPIQPDESPRATQARQDATRLADETKEEIDRIVAVTRAQDTEPRPPAAPQSTAAPAPAPPTAGESTGIGPIAYVGFGVGVVGFVTGGVLGVMAMSKASAASDAQNGCSTMACVQAAEDDVQSARGLGYASIASFGVAGLGVALGIVDLIVNPPRFKETHAAAVRVVRWIAPGAGGIRGSF